MSKISLREANLLANDWEWGFGKCFAEEGTSNNLFAVFVFAKPMRIMFQNNQIL